MIILVGGATPTVRRLAHTGRVGHMLSPRGRNLASIASTGLPMAADNDAFKAWDAERFWRMLRLIKGPLGGRVLWVACPDVVGDAQATVNRWHEWQPQLAFLGLPAAFVGQDGLEAIADQVPWADMACFFLGGTTAWKLSPAAEAFAREAKARGKLVHMGRCRSRRRIRHAVDIGCDSIDSSAFSAWPDRELPAAIRWVRQAERQPSLF